MQAGFSQVPAGCAATSWEATAADGGGPCDGCTQPGGSNNCYSYYGWKGWHGVGMCDGHGRVEQLFLNSANAYCSGLAGTLPPCLATLPGLRYLNLENIGAGLAGAVPADLGGGADGLDTLNLDDTRVDPARCRAYHDAHPGMGGGCL